MPPYHTPDRPVEPRPRRPAEIPPGGLLGSPQGIAQLVEDLWHQYRDDERAAFADYVLPDDNMGDVTWEDYKAMFKRFPSFPDWLRARGHLG